MPAYTALAHYNPALVALTGLATCVALYGLGRATARLLRLAAPSPWRDVLAATLGVLVYGMAVQLVAMAGLANRGVLIGLWLLLLAVGGSTVLAGLRGVRFARPEGPRGAWIVVAALGGAAAIINLLLALAPSTKIDEIYYHMLVPARIVLDGRLVFYLQPWLTAVVPQMGYQIAAAPLHALGLPDAPNVVSWGLGLMTGWLVFGLVYQRTRQAAWSLVAAVATQVGVYPSVWHNTGGAHALGDLSTAAAALALLFGKDLRASLSPARYAALLSLLCVTAAWTKISLLPLLAAMMAIGAAITMWGSRSREVGRVLLAFVLPWVVFYLPTAIWTLVQSGSPFGPILRDVLAPSIYDASIADRLQASRELDQPGLSAALRQFAILQNPLVWLGSLLALVLPQTPRRVRGLAAGLLAFQLALIYVLLPHDLRFLAGLPVALMTCAFAWGFDLLRDRKTLRPAAVAVALALVLVPWYALQVYRAAPLVPPVLWLEPWDNYVRRYVPLWDDFVALDQKLPMDAVLFTHSRIGTVYAPRPIVMDVRDAPAGRPLYVLALGEETVVERMTCAALRLPDGCKLGPAVYADPQAVANTYRTPGRQPRLETLLVRELLWPRPGRAAAVGAGS